MRRQWRRSCCRKQVNSTLTYTQSTMRTLLKSTASSMSGGTTNSVGAGLVNALTAMDTLIPYRTFLPFARK